MERLLDIAHEVEQQSQVKGAIALGRRRILQHRDVGADGLNDIKGRWCETIRWGIIRAERDVDVMPAVEGGRRAFDVIRPDRRGHKRVIEAADVSDWCGDERIASGLHRGREMVVGDLRDDHVSLGIPRA